MEYFIVVTRNCNLSCPFCFWKDISKWNSHSKLNSLEIKNFIEETNNLFGNEEEITVIVFYGGEPLLNQNLIEELIYAFEGNEKVIYCLYTNGIYLQSIKKTLLDNLSSIVVSIDGDKAINDKIRGEGAFKKVISNVIELKEEFQGEIAARLTLTSDSSLFPSVTGLLNIFDHIYWQFESSPTLENIDDQQRRYDRDLDLLLNTWLRNMENGRIYNIVPFQCIVTTLLWNERFDSLRCGCGTSLIVVDTDGKCYSCDELIDNNQFYLGDISEGIRHFNKNKYKNIVKYCDRCSIRSICGGRCLSAYIKYPKEKFFFYCNNTKILVNKIMKLLPRIKKIIERQDYCKKDFDTILSSYIFEGIP